MGHKVGDSVLVEVTPEDLRFFAKNNRAGRWNGDEFLVALPYSEQDTAMSIAKAIATSITMPILCAWKRITSISVDRYRQWLQYTACQQPNLFNLQT